MPFIQAGKVKLHYVEHGIKNRARLKEELGSN